MQAGSDNMLAQSVMAIGLCIITFVLVHSAISDFVSYRIPNWVLAFGGVAFVPAALLAALPFAQFAASVGAALLVLAAGFVLFSRNLIGGGDAKMAAVTALWCGADQAIPFLVHATLIGGILAIGLAALRRMVQHGKAPRFPGIEALQSGRREIPYGVALALGGLTVLPSTAWAP